MIEERKAILKVRNLKQYFKSGHGKNKIVVKAVDDVSFDIFEGEVFSLVGESGCGKTTTGRTLIKLYKSTGGNVNFLGRDIIVDKKLAKKQFKNGEITKETYFDIKEKSRFERNLDFEAKERLKGFNEKSEEAKEIVDGYYAEIERLEAELPNYLSQNTKESRQKVREIKSDIKLNKRLIKQDLKTYKYQQIHANRILMRKMQMIFQDPIASLNPRMTVKQIISEGLIINGVKNPKIIDKKVKDALRAVGLVEEHAARYPHEFSGGQRQRIGVARALVANPEFIIADEPISALDVSIRAQVINLLNDLRDELGITIMFIAHDLSVVKYFSDRIAVMYFGKIVEIGDKDKLFKNPLHPYTLALIDSIPLPDPLYEQNRGDLMKYNPQTAHDYSTDLPTLKEVEPDHFVLCNDAEFEKYQRIINENKS